MLSGTWPSQLHNQVRFHWSREGFRYLAIVITSYTSKLYEANYGKLLKEIKADMIRWEILPLSLIGRIETIRLNVLPRLLFLFQSLPERSVTVSYQFYWGPKSRQGRQGSFKGFIHKLYWAEWQTESRVFRVVTYLWADFRSWSWMTFHDTP